MDLTLNVRARVMAGYEAPFPDPMAAAAGEAVSLDRTRHTDLRGWVWCTNQAGKGGWVPEAYLEQQGDLGRLRRDYNAIELTIHPGESLTCHYAESGFAWVTNQAGQTGWVPATCISLEQPASTR